MPFFTSRKAALYAFLVIIFFAPAFTVSAEFNTTMDYILSEEKLSYGSASFALLAGTGYISEEASVQEASDQMAQLFPDTAMEWDSPVTLGSFSYMIMKAYEMDGGLMYRFFPGPRYAVRELKFKKIIQEKSYGTMNITGERAFRIIGRVLEREENRNAE